MNANINMKTIMNKLKKKKKKKKKKKSLDIWNIASNIKRKL